MNRITVCEDWENAQLQKIIEEGQPTASPSSINLAKNNNAMEMAATPLASNIPSQMMEPVTTIVAENVASSNEHIKTTTSTKTKKNMIPLNAANVSDLTHKGKFANSP